MSDLLYGLAALAAAFCVSYGVIHLIRCSKLGVCPFRRKPKTRSIEPAPAVPPMDKPLTQSDEGNALFLRDLQGNILNGHGRDYASHILLCFKAGCGEAARRLIAEFSAKYVVSAYDQFHASRRFKSLGFDAGIFGHIALSSSGYSALGISVEDQPHGLNPRRHKDGSGYAEVFRKGLKSRQKELRDDAQEWESAYQRDIHMLLILAGDSAAKVDEVEREVLASFSGIGEIVAVERGMALTRQLDPNDPSTLVHLEHFGFVDGRSQPLMLTEQIDEEKAKGIDEYDPTAPLSLVLAPDPLGTPGFSHGSFLVYRKLEQNVRGFNSAMRDLAAALGVSEDLARAMTMGRFQDGTPVTMRATAGVTDVPNNFDYDDDRDGLKCPFHAHIRKSNPRGTHISEAEDYRHKIARRGIPFGGALTTTSDLQEMPETGKGLLFFCYQSDIFEQFEFIQRTWANFPNFPKRDTGLDPVIGQGEKGNAARNWPSGWNKPLVNPGVNIAGFVKMKGGEYFFSPSLSFLKNLSRS